MPKWVVTRGSTHENGSTLRRDACNINHICHSVKEVVKLFLSFWSFDLSSLSTSVTYSTDKKVLPKEHHEEKKKKTP